MAQLDGALSDVHDTGHQKEVANPSMWMVQVRTNRHLRGIEDHEEARNGTQMPKQVPRHSFTEPGLGDVATVTNDGLGKCIYYLAHQDNQARIIVTHVDCLVHIPRGVGVPNIDDQIVGQVTNCVGQNLPLSQCILEVSVVPASDIVRSQFPLKVKLDW